MSLPISSNYFNKLSIKAPTGAIVKNNKDNNLWNRLHILKGDVPTVTEGRIPGRNCVGIIVQIGGRVSIFNIDDRFLNLPGAIHICLGDGSICAEHHDTRLMRVKVGDLIQKIQCVKKSKQDFLDCD